jgi:hypothetical protein
MKRSALFVLVLLAAGRLVSAPVHDARFLQLSVSYRLHADGSWDMTCERQVRLDTYLAVNRALGETFIVYDPAFQKLEVLRAETTMADGRKVPAPANAFNEVLPIAAHGFADFSGLREMVVTHTGLERGARVDLKYRIHTAPGFLPVFSGIEPLRRDFPVDRYELAIEVPSGVDLAYEIRGAAGATMLETAEPQGGKRHVLRFSGLPPVAHDLLAPPQSEPFIVFSASREWQRALELPVAPAPLPAALRERIAGLKTALPVRIGLPAPRLGPQAVDLLAALQRIVAGEIAGCGLGAEAIGWRARPLERVLQGHYGTRLEKALLLQAMIREAGYEAELLAVAAGGEFAPEVATPLQLGDFLLKVEDGPHALYLDAFREASGFFPYAAQGLSAWNLARGTLETLPDSDWQRNGVDVSGTAQLGADGAGGVLTVCARGCFQRYDEAAADPAAFIAGLLRRFFPVDKAELKKLLALTRDEICAEVAFSGKWLKELGAGLLVAEFPRLPGLAEAMVIQERRQAAVALEAPFRASLRLEIEPAAGLKLDMAAAALERRSALGFLTRGLEAGQDGRLHLTVAAGIAKRTVAAVEYPQLRELLLPYFVPGWGMVFKKGK